MKEGLQAVEKGGQGGKDVKQSGGISGGKDIGQGVLDETDVDIRGESGMKAASVKFARKSSGACVEDCRGVSIDGGGEGGDIGERLEVKGVEVSSRVDGEGVEQGGEGGAKADVGGGGGAETGVQGAGD